jgi:hypothetical protein
MAHGKTTTKKSTHTVHGLFLKVTCPKTSKEVMIEISVYDIMHSEQECEICGSHGEISVDFKCPECGEFHEHEIRKW